jgi:hypothetical protein
MTIKFGSLPNVLIGTAKRAGVYECYWAHFAGGNPLERIVAISDLCCRCSETALWEVFPLEALDGKCPFWTRAPKTSPRLKTQILNDKGTLSFADGAQVNQTLLFPRLALRFGFEGTNLLHDEEMELSHCCPGETCVRLV